MHSAWNWFESGKSAEGIPNNVLDVVESLLALFSCSSFPNLENLSLLLCQEEFDPKTLEHSVLSVRMS